MDTTEHTPTPEELTILQALESKPLSEDDLEKVLGSMGHDNLRFAIYQLTTQKYLIAKSPVLSGCAACRCEVKYVLRLTFAGRAALRHSKQV
jgi:bacterioferritin-associated ferredoxin